MVGIGREKFLWKLAEPDWRNMTVINGLSRTRLPSDQVIATDAGVRNQAHGIGAVSSRGGWLTSGYLGSGTTHDCFPHCCPITELRAIALALGRLWNAEEPVTVLTDSQDAVSWFAKWRSGSREMLSERYALTRHGGKASALVLLQRIAVAPQYQELVSVEWVRGHAGHLLNEAADALATIGLDAAPVGENERRLRHLSEPEAEAAGQRLVDGFLSSIDTGMKRR
jgi:ribonuclease HI